MIKAILFDLDGLLFDSEPTGQEATLRLIRSYGFSFRGDPAIFLGLRNADSMKIIKKMFGIHDSTREMIKKRYKIYHKIGRDIKLMPGFTQISKLIERHNWKKGLATSATRHHATWLLKKQKLNNYFDAETTGEGVKDGKPHPEIYLKTAKKLKVKPKDCLVLEDSPNGLLAAKRAGMKCIVVPNRIVKKAEYKQADALVSSLAQINLNLIKKL